jgi:hypothetical protein
MTGKAASVGGLFRFVDVFAVSHFGRKIERLPLNHRSRIFLVIAARLFNIECPGSV